MKKIDINRLASAVFQKHRDGALQFALKQSEKYLRAADSERSRLWFKVGEALVALEARHDAAMRLTQSLAASSTEGDLGESEENKLSRRKISGHN